jgi:organic radical activating enzyme
MKLRLLFTKICNRNCPGCCNKDWDLDALKKVSLFDYDEILITGGEPLLFPEKLIGYVEAIRVVSKAKIYVYTAMTIHNNSFKSLYEVMKVVDGITLTLHEQQDVTNLAPVLYSIKHDSTVNKVFKDKSLRLNVFLGLDLKGLDLSDWKVKEGMVWVENCPLPTNEVFRKI